VKYNITVTKINEVMSFDDETMPTVSREWLIEYGLKQKLADSHASVKRTEYPEGDEGTTKWLADVRTAAYAVRDAILNGNPGARRSGVDPELAVASKYGMTVEQFRAMMAQTMTKAEKKARQAA
jgi:hypothetical protein